MEPSIRLSKEERKILLQAYRADVIARRALVLLLLAEGGSYRSLRKATFASPTLIRNVKPDFAAGGVVCVLRSDAQQPFVVPGWLIIITRWLLQFTPRDFGFFRSRWSCEGLALLLREQSGISLCAETIRRGLQRMQFVWRRPRPVVGPPGSGTRGQTAETPGTSGATSCGRDGGLSG